jgi:hypothetical protein
MADFEKIFVIKDQGEASFLDMILDERNIPHLIRSYHDSAYDGLFQMQKGWGVLYAAEEHRDVINSLRLELDASSQESEPDKI